MLLHSNRTILSHICCGDLRTVVALKVTEEHRTTSQNSRKTHLCEDCIPEACLMFLLSCFKNLKILQQLLQYFGTGLLWDHLYEQVSL